MAVTVPNAPDQSETSKMLDMVSAGDTWVFVNASLWNLSQTCLVHISPQNQKKEIRYYALHIENEAYF